MKKNIHFFYFIFLTTLIFQTHYLQSADQSLQKIGISENLFSESVKDHRDKDAAQLLLTLAGSATFSEKISESDSQLTNSKKTDFECPLCKKLYVNKAVLKNHLKIHSNERPFACESCPKAFKDPSTLRHHTTVHTKEKKHTCTICKRAFAQPGHLKIHEKQLHNEHIVTFKKNTFKKSRFSFEDDSDDEEDNFVIPSGYCQEFILPKKTIIIYSKDTSEQ